MGSRADSIINGVIILGIIALLGLVGNNTLTLNSAVANRYTSKDAVVDKALQNAVDISQFEVLERHEVTIDDTVSAVADHEARLDKANL